MKNSIRYRGAVLWNLVSDYFNDSGSFKQFYRKAKNLIPHLGKQDLRPFNSLSRIVGSEE